MSLRRQEGEYDILYATTTDPGTDTARKDPANYTRVGLLSDLDTSLSNDAQSALDRDSSQHESVIYGQQSSAVNATVNVQEENESGTTTEEPGHVLLRDATLNQDVVHYLIQPEDDTGSAITGLDGEYGAFVVEEFNRTSNSGEFKQYDISGAGRKQPTFFTV